MRRNLWIGFIVIIVIAILAGLVDWPTGPNLRIGKIFREIKIHEGLDLKGGTRLVYALDLSGVDQKDQPDAISSVKDVIDRRVNSLGVTEPNIYSTTIGDTKAIAVELPGVTDVNEAINLIGKTAQLKFQEQDESSQWVETGLTGAHLKRADVEFNPQTGDPEVALTFDDEGKTMFADITKGNLQKPVAILLDNEIISAPTVQSEIKDGKAVITGKFSVEEAKNLAKLLNAGALPVPISIIEQRSIGATLGDESVKRSLAAGLVGLVLLALFMIIYYRIPGFLATVALFIYTLIVLALFKLIPVTLTLAGIAGFILSIGMAVDANILIFERMKEEIRDGKTLALAVDTGFSRAWSSIRDSNISSLITCLILYIFTTSLVRGFALTLAIGILVSMFTAIVVTRTFLRLLIDTQLAKRLMSSYGIKK